MKHCIVTSLAVAAVVCVGAADTNEVAATTDLGTVVVEGSALSKYRPETAKGGTFTDVPPEKLPCVVDTLTEDFIREKNPTDLNDLLRWVPGIETGGTSLLVRQPGLFSVRGMGGTEPALDGVIPIGRGAGLFLDPHVMERVEIVKGPIASLAGGAGAQQNNNGAGGAINLYLKGAHLGGDEILFQENTSVGRNTWRQRAMLDANEVVADDKVGFRAIGTFDIFSPVYTSTGSQKGARPREQYSLAPSIVFQSSEDVTIGVKTLFVSSDSPSYVGIPVWRGAPAAGYSWHESSCRKNDRSTYAGMFVTPYVDWQVTDEWLIKFGGAFTHSHMEQTTREPYCGRGAELANFYKTGLWTSAGKYMTSGFSESRMFQQGYNLYARTVYALEELPCGLNNTFLVQPDFYYREATGSFGVPTSRYGASVQDALGWGWVTLLGGVRYDYFVENDTDQTTAGRPVHCDEARESAFSPRGGLTVQPLDWLVFFGNVSETVTPTLGYRDADGSRPTDPWTAKQWESGFRVRPVEKLWLSASYFNIEQENLPVQDPTTLDYYFEGHNRSKGVELSLTGDITEDWTVFGSYAWTKYEDCTESGRAGSFERIPRHTVSFNTSCRLHGFDLVEDVIVGMGYRFRSKSYATMRGAFVDENLYFDPSHVFDLNASVPFTKFGGPEDWYLTLGVRNLFDERYFDTARHFYECFAGDPRTFEIGLRARF